MHFIIKIILPLISLIILFGCRTHSPCQVPLQTRQQICLDLKRQLIFYNNETDKLYPNHYGGNWNNPARQAELLRRYCRYDCANVLRECPID